MPARIVLNLSAPRVSWGVFAHGRLQGFTRLANDAAARAAFVELLAAHPKRPVAVMLDVVEEDFRQEALPHVWGRARRAMVERKLAQYFRTTPYRAACLQGRGAGRRRDDRYLFLALTNTDLLQPWLEAINAQGAPLSGIHLLPAVSQPLVQKLGSRGALLLVSLQGGGLRQSLFLDGQLTLSRLTPMEETPAEALLTLLPEEMEKSRLFFYNSRVLSRDALLTAWVLDPDGRLAPACRQVSEEPNFRCQVVAAETLARALAVPVGELPQDMDAIMLSLLPRAAAACNLAPPAQRRRFLEQRLRQVLYATAAGIALAGGAAAAWLLVERQGVLKDAAALRKQTAELAARYAAATRSFPAAPASAEEMRATVEAFALLRAQARTPATALRLVGSVLPAYPQVELSRLTWKRGQGGNANEEEVELAAEIRPFDGDFRAALALIQRLTEDFRNRPAVKAVKVVALPVNLDPSAPLSGNTAESREAQSARFRLLLTLEGSP